jgi:hypothetical protein
MIGRLWKKSSKSGSNGGSCVEVRQHDDAVQVRDSKNPTGSALTFDRDQWRAFIAAAKAGEFDL